MPAVAKELGRMPGLEVVGHGVYLRPNQTYVLKDIIFERKNLQAYFAGETGETYGVPEGYLVDNSPPMPASQAMNQVVIEESWDRFEKRTSLDASATVGSAPFSVDVNASQLSQLRQEEDCYYAMRTSFIPLWTLYLPHRARPLDAEAADVPTPFSHTHRKAYARFFERYGTHYIQRAWLGGKASLALTTRKSSGMTMSQIQAGIKASAAAYGSASVSAEEQQQRANLRSNSECTVFGSGGEELKLASISTLDEDLYNQWLQTVSSNPQVIAFDAVGIWALIDDEAKAAALMEAYQEETIFVPIRAVYNLDDRIHFFEDFQYYTYDIERSETSRPERIQDKFPQLFEVGFERVDAAFLGKYLRSETGEDLSRKLFLFNRDTYVRWDVDRYEIDEGYPRLITVGWPGVTFNRIDTVVNVTPDAVYFFAGGQYIRFNTINNRADDGYPQDVAKRWAGVTFDRIDAGTYWGNGKVYFFRDNQFIRYDTVTWRSDAGYPKTIASHYVEDWKFFD